MKYTAFLVFFLILQTSAFAQSEATRNADAAFRKADGELNQVYSEVMKRLPTKEAKAELADSERKWLQYRDADASFRAGLTSRGGSAYSMDKLSNLTELALDRTQQLKKLLKAIAAL